ncbi:MAG: hypothetical protein ABR579_01680 [Actinomycetota bacterium]
MNPLKWSSVAAVIALSLLISSSAFAAPVKLAANVTFTGEKKGDSAGYQVAWGDLNGDGIDDAIIGAAFSGVGGQESGEVYVVYGPVKHDLNLKDADAHLHTAAAGDYVGEGPIGVADINGDGADDLLIGAPGSLVAAQPGSPGKVGEVFLVYGGHRLRGDMNLSKTADARFTGIQMEEWLGFGVSSLGDLDGDGCEDVLIGAPATAGFTGAAYLFYGAPKKLSGDIGVGKADATFVGTHPDELFGYQAAGSDLNADGHGDVFISSLPIENPSTVNIFYGSGRISGVVPEVTADANLIAPASDYFVGSQLTTGDVTGDGKSDLMAGVGVSQNVLDTPTTYVIAGGETVSGIQSLSTAATTTITGAGDAVATGDFNGDGYVDLASSSAASSTTFVFLGPIKGQSVATTRARFVFRGPKSSQAGHSVAMGQATTDHRGDVAIGAPGGAGRVFVAKGRPSK